VTPILPEPSDFEGFGVAGATSGGPLGALVGLLAMDGSGLIDAKPLPIDQAPSPDAVDPRLNAASLPGAGFQGAHRIPSFGRAKRVPAVPEAQLSNLPLHAPAIDSGTRSLDVRGLTAREPSTMATPTWMAQLWPIFSPV